MRIKMLLPVTLVTLALSATVGCQVETSASDSKPATQAPSKALSQAPSQTQPKESASTPAPAAEPLKIDGTGAVTGATACAGRDVIVDGEGVVAELSGSCGKLTVKGTGNTVTVEKVAAITVSGTANVVTWGSATGGGEPKVTNSGTGNTVTRQ